MQVLLKIASDPRRISVAPLFGPELRTRMVAIARALIEGSECPHYWEPVHRWDGPEITNLCRLCGAEEPSDEV